MLWFTFQLRSAASTAPIDPRIPPPQHPHPLEFFSPTVVSSPISVSAASWLADRTTDPCPLNPRQRGFCRSPATISRRCGEPILSSHRSQVRKRVRPRKVNSAPAVPTVHLEAAQRAIGHPEDDADRGAVGRLGIRKKERRRPGPAVPIARTQVDTRAAAATGADHAQVFELAEEADSAGAGRSEESFNQVSFLVCNRPRKLHGLSSARIPHRVTTHHLESFAEADSKPRLRPEVRRTGWRVRTRPNSRFCFGECDTGGRRMP